MVLLLITFNLDRVLNDLNMSRHYFSQCSGIRPNTINDMCNNNTKRIEIKTLNAILTCLNNLSEKEINIADVMTYVNDKEEV